MRILLVNDHIYCGGGGDVILQAERMYLEACGYEVFLYGWGNALSKTDQIIEYPESNHLSSRHLIKFFGSRKLRLHFRETLKALSPDIVHIHLVSKYPLAVYPELKGYKVIQTLHGPNLFCATSWGCLRNNSGPCEMGIGWKCFSRGCVSFPEMLAYAQLARRIKPHLKRNIAYWHCPSRNIYNTASALGYEKLAFIPLGVETPEGVERNLYIENKDQIILFVGAVAKVKGVDVLYEAFKNVLTEFPGAKLLIAGDGELVPTLKQKIIEDGCSDSVRLLGKIPHNKVNELYKQASVFAMPSIWQEQFGLVGPEALSMGIPVIGSNIGGIPEWLHHNEWGYLVTPRDKVELTQRICQLLSNRDLAEEMGKRGRIFVKKEYSLEKYLFEIKRLIDSLYNNEDYSYDY